MSTFRYELYSLSPVDTVAVRRSVRGYNRYGVLTVVLVTAVVLLLVLLLPRGSPVVAPVVLALLLGPADQAAYDRYLAATKAQLDPQAFAAAWEVGQRMTLSQAVACALEPSPENPANP